MCSMFPRGRKDRAEPGVPTFPQVSQSAGSGWLLGVARVMGQREAVGGQGESFPTEARNGEKGPFFNIRDGS